MNSNKTIILVLGLLALTGCSEYWWSRGQPPAVSTLIDRSKTTFEQALAGEGQSRKDVSPIFETIKKELLLASECSANPSQSAQQSHLAEAAKSFDQLEGLLSYGNRAAYGELNGQLRVFVSKSNQGAVDCHALGMYVARVFFWAADELRVPAPVAIG